MGDGGKDVDVEIHMFSTRATGCGVPDERHGVSAHWLLVTTKGRFGYPSVMMFIIGSWNRDGTDAGRIRRDANFPRSEH
jgi:hypothetical protein